MARAQRCILIFHGYDIDRLCYFTILSVCLLARTICPWFAGIFITPLLHYVNRPISASNVYIHDGAFFEPEKKVGLQCVFNRFQSILGEIWFKSKPAISYFENICAPFLCMYSDSEHIELEHFSSSIALYHYIVRVFPSLSNEENAKTGRNVHEILSVSYPATWQIEFICRIK